MILNEFPPNENKTDFILSDVLKVKISDVSGNSNIYDIGLRYTVYDMNISTSTTSICGSTISDRSLYTSTAIYGHNSAFDQKTITYCYQGSCSSNWEGAIKPKFPQFTNSYGFSNIQTARCASTSGLIPRYYRYGATIRGRWFEGYLYYKWH